MRCVGFGKVLTLTCAVLVLAKHSPSHVLCRYLQSTHLHMRCVGVGKVLTFTCAVLVLAKYSPSHALCRCWQRTHLHTHCVGVGKVLTFACTVSVLAKYSPSYALCWCWPNTRLHMPCVSVGQILAFTCAVSVLAKYSPSHVLCRWWQNTHLHMRRVGVGQIPSYALCRCWPNTHLHMRCAGVGQILTLTCAVSVLAKSSPARPAWPSTFSLLCTKGLSAKAVWGGKKFHLFHVCFSVLCYMSGHSWKFLACTTGFPHNQHACMCSVPFKSGSCMLSSEIEEFCKGSYCCELSHEKSLLCIAILINDFMSLFQRTRRNSNDVLSSSKLRI